MAYDGYARLTGYTRTGEATQANLYNGMDDWVQVTSGTVIRRYLYDGAGRVLGEYGTSATNVIAETIWLSPDAVNDNQPFGGDDGVASFVSLGARNVTDALICRIISNFRRLM